MAPFAHGLRDHQLFDQPNRIDRTKTIRHRRPNAWRTEVDGQWVDVLPLVEDVDREYRNGWLTYVYYFKRCPEVEVIGGGINTKTVKGGGLWRQGNLFHFGFDLSPSEMNRAGRALLLNSVAYISRFTEDRPIAKTPSVFVKKVARTRVVLDHAYSRSDFGLEYLRNQIADDVLAELPGNSLEEVKPSLEKIRPYLRDNGNGKLGIDEQARRFGVAPDSPAFFPAMVGALNDGGERARKARELLERYRPDSAPVADDVPAKWRSWWDENKHYLFYSDAGGFRWYIDPLAKQRGVPTSELTGPARATKPPITEKPAGSVE